MAGGQDKVVGRSGGEEGEGEVVVGSDPVGGQGGGGDGVV